MKCNFCSLIKFESVWKPELNTKQALDIIDQLAESGVVILSISGGEPLLREDLGKVISRAKNKGMNVFVATNGWFLKERADLLCDAYAIRVSIDGIGKLHDKFRMEGSYDRAVSGIKVLLANKKNVAIHSVITTQTTYDQVVGLCELAKQLGIQISFGNCVPTMPTKRNSHIQDVNKEVLALKPDDSWFFEVMGRIRKEYSSVMADPPIIYKLISNQGLDKFGCQSMFLDLALKPDGSVAMPCDGWFVESAKGNLKEIWHSELADKVRKNVGKYHFCKDCKIKCHVYPALLMKPRTLIELAISYKV